MIAVLEHLLIVPILAPLLAGALQLFLGERRRARVACGLASVLARTSPDGGPRGFTAFLVERTDAWHNLPKVRTLGIRGADISGFTLDEAPGEPIGEVGDGLPVVLRPPSPNTDARDVDGFAPCRTCGGPVGMGGRMVGPWREHADCATVAAYPPARLVAAAGAHGLTVTLEDDEA